MRSTKACTLLCLLAVPLARAECPKVEGSFNIEQLSLYPESAAWDPQTCRLYLSSVYNCTLVVYDAYTQTSETFALPGITNYSSANYTKYHLNGIDYDPVSKNIYVAASWAPAFTSTLDGDDSDANFTGPNHILRYNTEQKRVVSSIDLSPAQQQFHRKTHHLTNGFQDMASNTLGDTFAIGTFGNSIVKIFSRSNKPELWYAPSSYNETYGFGGIFSYKDTIVVSDTHTSGLVTFDTSSAHPRARQVPIQGLPSDYHPLMADGLFSPSRYQGTIALWSNDYNGTAVIESTDGWKTAHFLGLVENDDPETRDGFAVATFDIDRSIFVVTEWFQSELPVQPKTSWKIVDITEHVQGLITGAHVKND